MRSAMALTTRAANMTARACSRIGGPRKTGPISTPAPPRWSSNMTRTSRCPAEGQKQPLIAVITVDHGCGFTLERDMIVFWGNGQAGIVGDIFPQSVLAD